MKSYRLPETPIKSRFVITFALSCCVSAVLVACGGGSSGSSKAESATPSVNETPSTPAPEKVLYARVDFPSVFTDLRGVSEITVYGSLIDATGGVVEAGEVASFDVNGVAPVVDMSTGKWTARVVLPALQSQPKLVTNVTDLNGNNTVSELVVNNRAFIPFIEHVAVVPGTDTVLAFGLGSTRLVMPASQQMLLRDGEAMENGDRLVLGGKSRRAANVVAGGASAVFLPNSYTADGGTFWRINLADGSVVEVGKALSPLGGEAQYLHYIDYVMSDSAIVYTGVGSTFQGEPFGGTTVPTCWLGMLDIDMQESSYIIETPAYVVDDGGAPVAQFCPGALTLDLPRNRAIVAHNTDDAPVGFSGVYAVDLATGALTVISSGERGSGPPITESPSRLFATGDDETVIALVGEALIRVDLQTGDRQFVLESPAWPTLVTSIDYDVSTQKMFVASDGRKVSRLDLDTGELTELANFSLGVGSGVEISTGLRGVVDTIANRLLFVDEDELNDVHVIRAIDLDTLVRTELFSIQAKPSFTDPAPVFDATNNALYLGGNENNRWVTKIALDTGEEQVLVGGGVGSGNILYEVDGLCFDEAQGLLYLLAEYPAPSGRPVGLFNPYGVYSLDVVTGERTRVSSEDQALSEADKRMQFILCDSANDRVLVTTQEGAIIAVAHSTATATAAAPGERTLLVPANDRHVGLDHQAGFYWDSEPGRVLMQWNAAMNAPGDEVHSIELATGESETIARDLTYWTFDGRSDLFYAEETFSIESEMATGIRAVQRLTEQETVISRAE